MRKSKSVPRTIADILRGTLRELEASTDSGKDAPLLIEVRVHLLRTLRALADQAETPAPPIADAD